METDGELMDEDAAIDLADVDGGDRTSRQGRDGLFEAQRDLQSSCEEVHRPGRQDCERGLRLRTGGSRGRHRPTPAADEQNVEIGAVDCLTDRVHDRIARADRDLDLMAMHLELVLDQRAQPVEIGRLQRAAVPVQ